jgi:hypothetical protein
MQQYSVQVYDNFMKENIGKLGQEPQGYWKWNGAYDEDFGLSNNPTTRYFHSINSKPKYMIDKEIVS